jgi:hypothetical protein
MKIADLKKTYVPILARLHKKLFDGAEMTDLEWIDAEIEGKIPEYLQTVKNKHTLASYANAVNHVLDYGSKPDRKERDRLDYYKRYRAKREGTDADWKLFQRALSYLKKANMPPEKATKKNSVREPSDRCTDKYGLYMKKGIWKSKVVDEWCKTHKCTKN